MIGDKHNTEALGVTSLLGRGRGAFSSAVKGMATDPGALEK